MITLTQINEMDLQEFVSCFGDIAEHSPWVAEAAKRHFSTRDDMIQAFGETVFAAAEHQQLSLLRFHPDLATKAKLTAESTHEQKGAGLDSLNPQEFAEFNSLNERYKTQNGFPFIYAVKGATKHQILDSFQQRIHHERAEEFKVALQQVCKIIGLRLSDRVAE